MKDEDSATQVSAPVLSTTGLGWGLLGVVAFSFTVPLTRVAVAGMSPLFIGSARAVGAAVLAGCVLALTRPRAPTIAQWMRLLVVVGGVVLGFPLLLSYGLQTAPASHGAVVIGLLPAATAVVAVVRTRERPTPSFWVFAFLGAAAAVTFAALGSHGVGALQPSDVLLLASVLAAAVGYAEGGMLSRELGSWQTICWALVLAIPASTLLAALAYQQQRPHATAVEWLAFAYLAAVSMFLGFFAWYRGLAIGPMAMVSQTQLAQPVLSILWAVLLLHERISPVTAIGAAAVIACAALAVRARRQPRKTEPWTMGGSTRLTRR